jgi:predicted MFS family arabinose efflux permease
VRGVASSRALSFLEAAKLIGILVGALSGGFIAQRWGLRAPLIAYCAPIAIAFLVALTLRERRGVTGGAPTTTEPSRYLALIRTGFRIFRADSMLQLIAFEAALTNALVWTLIWLYQPVLQRSGIPVAWFGIVQTTASVAQIAILTNIARVEHIFGTLRRFIVVATFVAAAALVAVGLTQHHFVVIAGIIVAITFGLCRVPLYAAEMNARIPSAQRATVLSVTSMVRTLSIAAVNPLVGYFADRSLSSTLLSLGIALFITAALFIAARGRRTTSPAT